MKIKKVNEAVDWEASMKNNNGNIDRLARLRTQVNIDPVMEEVIDSNEKADKNAKEVFTKLAKDAKDVTPKNPDTGKKITIKPYTEKLALDESLFENKSLKEEFRLYADFGDYSPWSGAVDTWDKIRDNDKLDDLEFFLETTYPEGMSITELNDLLWFDGDEVLGWLGISNDEEDDYDSDNDDFDECMNEDYYHFEYKSGANPYIAKTEKERDRILRKYKNKVTKKDDKSFVIDDTERDSFAIEEDYDRPIATMGLTNTSGVGIYGINGDTVTYAFLGGEGDIEKEEAEIEWDCESEECRPYFDVNGQKYYIDEFIRTNLGESKEIKNKEDCEHCKKESDNKKDLLEYAEEENEDDIETVFDFVDERLFGTTRTGSRSRSSNYKKVNKFLSDITIPLGNGKGRFSEVFFYPDSTIYTTDEREKAGSIGRRYPMSSDDSGFGVYLVNEDEAVLAKAVADELNFQYKLVPITHNKDFNYVAKIFIPESILEMPISDYLESIGKSIYDYKNPKYMLNKK